MGGAREVLTAPSRVQGVVRLWPGVLTSVERDPSCVLLPPIGSKQQEIVNKCDLLLRKKEQSRSCQGFSPKKPLLS